MSRVRLENITKRFGNVVAVDNVSLEIEKGAFFSVVGPSGCGKTTIMRMMAGLETPNAGRIWIGDRLVFAGDDRTFVPPAQRRIGMVFQSYALWPHMTVYENIAFGLQVNKVGREEIKRKVQRVLELFQLGNLADRYPSELSGGQQQRVAIARELVAEREVLFMDEPLSNLDARLRMEMRAELKRLHAETGTTIIYVTHDQLEALSLSTKIAVMKDGRIQQVGPPNEIYFKPANLFVAEFIGLNPINTLKARVDGNRLTSGDVRLPVDLEKVRISGLHRDADVVLAVRPEALRLVDVATERSLAGTVETVLTAGPTQLVQVLVREKSTTLRLTVQESHEKQVSPGQQVYVEINPRDALFFDAKSEASLSGQWAATEVAS